MILVTGSAGFIGTNLTRKLGNTIMVDSQYNINMTNLNGDYLISASKIIKANFDVTALEIIQPEPYEPLTKIDCVVHLGAISDTTFTDSLVINYWNYTYSVRLYDYCRKNNIPFIYASSAATYGDGKKGFSDNLLPSELKPLNLYAETKNKFDQYVLDNPSNALCVGLKFFNVYGYYEHLKNYNMTSMFYKGINEIKQTGKIQLFNFGHQKRDFVFIDDVVDVISWFMKQDSSKNGIYNVGTGDEKRFNEVAFSLFNALNVKYTIKYIKMPSSLKDKYQNFTKADISKLRKAGYTQNFTSISEGAKKLVQFYGEEKGNTSR